MSIITESGSNSDSEIRDFHNESLSFYRSWDDDTFFEPMATQIGNHTIQSRLTDVDFSASESMVSTLENGIYRTRIANARRDFIEPLHASMGFYAEENRKLVSLHHRENVSLLRSIDERLMKVPEETSNPILGGLKRAYFNFTRMPVWTTIKATYDFVLKPLLSGVKSLFLGFGKEDKSVLKELKRQTELARTGQINQERGFFQRFEEDGILGMGATGLTQVLTAGEVSRERAQDAANRKARGESMTMFDKLSMRFHKDIVLPDREKAMAMIKTDEKDVDSPEVPLLDDIRKNTKGLLDYSRHESNLIEGEFKRLTDELVDLNEMEADKRSVLDAGEEQRYRDSAFSAFSMANENIPLIQEHTEATAENSGKDSSGGGSGGGIIGGILSMIPLLLTGLALAPLISKLPLAEIASAVGGLVVNVVNMIPWKDIAMFAGGLILDGIKMIPWGDMLVATAEAAANATGSLIDKGLDAAFGEERMDAANSKLLEWDERFLNGALWGGTKTDQERMDEVFEAGRSGELVTGGVNLPEGEFVNEDTRQHWEKIDPVTGATIEHKVDRPEWVTAWENENGISQNRGNTGDGQIAPINPEDFISESGGMTEQEVLKTIRTIQTREGDRTETDKQLLKIMTKMMTMMRDTGDKFVQQSDVETLAASMGTL